jgi:hypothetical protein
MMVWFAVGTRAAAVERHQILAELTHPHSPPGTWLAAGLVVWSLSSDGPTMRLGNLLRAWRGSPGQPPRVGDRPPRRTALRQPRSTAAALALIPQALPSPGPAMS